MKNMISWVIEDHLCRSCGGRVLRSVRGAGMTPGGNPIYKCSVCGKSSASLSASSICWCGFSHRLNNTTAYRCLPFSVLEKHPKLEAAFRACGCDPKRGEVGIALETDVNRLLGAK